MEFKFRRKLNEKIYILLLLLLAGTYCSVVTLEPVDKDSEFAVNLAPTSDYVIYSDCATLPTLYISINMLTHTKPSYMYMGRPGT